jgi:nitroreductase
MMLAAHSLGLGTCCLGGPVDLLTKSEAARPYYEALGFSEGYSLKYILAVGWPEEAPDARPRDESKVKFVEFE